MQELLHATYQYSRLLNYYNTEDDLEGDWTCFWKAEMLTFLAHLSAINVYGIQDQYEQIKREFAALLEETEGANFNTVQNEYHLRLINYLRQQAIRIEEMLRYLPENLPLRQEIKSLIEKDTITDTDQLADSLRELIGFHKEAYQRVNRESLPIDQYRTFLGGCWGIADENAFYQIDSSDTYRFNDQEDIDQLFKAFIQTFKKVKMRADFYFDSNLNTPQLRQPHVALFLTFLRLFDRARNSLNELTRRHLDFYYEQVLCLQRRPEVPDGAYLILELASTVDRHLVEKGTAFLAGQDSNGRPLIFRTLEDWFLNRTQVKDIKTTYLDINKLFRNDLGTPTQRILSNPDVNLAFKAGEELPNTNATSWRSMGDNPDLPNGELGFAIASPQLILREGRRRIDFIVQIKSPSLSGLVAESFLGLNRKDLFHLELSSVEEWQSVSYDENLDLDSTSLNSLQTVIDPVFNFEFQEDSIEEPSTYQIRFRILLEKDHLPVDTLGKELQEEFGVKSKWPIFRVFLTSKDLSLIDDYLILREVVVEQIDINVKVDDIQENLIIQSDQGVFDGTQKFYPFGPIPEKGDHFFIGSTEVFQKALEELTVTFDWIDQLTGFQRHYKEYKTELLNIDPDNNSLRIQEPFVKVDFIDRANDRFPERLSQTGRRGDGNTILIKVTDIEDQPQVAIPVLVNYASSTPSLLVETNDRGEVEVSVESPADTILINQFDPNPLPDPPPAIRYNSQFEPYPRIYPSNDPESIAYQ